MLILLLSLLMLVVGLTLGLVITKRAGPVEHDATTRGRQARPYAGMTKQETRYHQAMYYLAGACWNEGAADTAIKALTTLLERTRALSAPTQARPAIEAAADLVRPLVHENPDSGQRADHP